MRTRRFFAAAVLAAVTLCVGTLNAPPSGSAETAEFATHATETGNGPRALYSTGITWKFSRAIASLLIGSSESTRLVVAV